MISRGRFGGRMTAGEVDHGPVGSDRDQVAPVRDLIGCEPQAERRGLDGGTTGVVHRRVVAEDAHVADVAAGRHPWRDHRRASDLAASRQRVERRHRRDLERRPATEL